MLSGHDRDSANRGMQTGPTIGIICDHKSLQLAGRIIGAGYRIARVSPDQLQAEDLLAPDAWVVDCADNSSVSEAMAWIEQEVVVLSNRPDPTAVHEYENWCTRIVHTLDKWSADYWHASSAHTQSEPGAYAGVEAVWVIAGSTGGVGAAAEFFNALSYVPPVAFIYAQHIHANQQSMLTAVGHSNPDLVCALAVGRHWLNPGHVLIVPAACRLEFSNQGEVFSIRDNWGTEETPNIDRLMMTMSGMRPSPAGAIILSGAGSDGTEGLRALHAVGTKIWAQDPESAVSPSMPRSAVAQGLVSQCAGPRALAAEFMNLYPPRKA